MVAHAREGSPAEVCGVLGGESGERSRADRSQRVENVATTPRTRYELDPAAQLAAMQTIEADGREVVGFYHSHPEGPAGPSETDAAQATWPGYSYVIVSLAGEAPSVRAWRWTGESFEREQVRVQASGDSPT
jgi:proteasome lid subunit RPN8/RPN11